MSQPQDRLLALAGIFQAAQLVQQLAHAGRAEREVFRASVHSILMLDAENTAEIYGGVRGVTLGLTILRDKLGGAANPGDLEMARYAMSTVQLAATLTRRSAVADIVTDGIRTIESQMKFFEAEEDGAAHPRLVDKLAELYQQTLSTLNPRIMVNGAQGYLAVPHIAASVRAALFAGVRSAVLWRQLGGSRWQLLFARRQIAAAAAALLAGTP